MIISVTGIHEGGTETSFHLQSDALDAALQKALDKCRKTGKIAAALLEELQGKETRWQFIIDEQLELDVI